MTNPLFSESPCGPSCVPATDLPPRVGRARYALRWAALAATFALAPVLGAAASLAGPRVGRLLMRTWSRAFLAAVGIRVEVTGTFVPSGPVLVVANHVTAFDPLAMLSRYPFVTVVTHDAATNPLVGGLLRGSGAVFHRRGRLDGVAPLIAAMTAALRAGDSVAVAPEGRTRCCPPGGPFKPAPLQAAVDAGVPVRPVLIRCRLIDGTPTTHASLLDTWAASLRRTMRIRGLILELHALPDLDPTAVPDRKALARRAHHVLHAASPPTTCVHDTR